VKVELREVFKRFIAWILLKKRSRQCDGCGVQICKATRHLNGERSTLVFISLLLLSLIVLPA
jgi:hypothetical protein